MAAMSKYLNSLWVRDRDMPTARFTPVVFNPALVRLVSCNTASARRAAV
jgi:hypothetical protein